MKKKNDRKCDSLSSQETQEISSQILIVRALEIGITLSDLDRVTIGFLIDLLMMKQKENEDEEIEATPEMLERF